MLRRLWNRIFGKRAPIAPPPNVIVASAYIDLRRTPPEDTTP